jgi:hypothetical protein
MDNSIFLIILVILVLIFKQTKERKSQDRGTWQADLVERVNETSEALPNVKRARAVALLPYIKLLSKDFKNKLPKDSEFRHRTHKRLLD